MPMGQLPTRDQITFILVLIRNFVALKKQKKLTLCDDYVCFYILKFCEDIRWTMYPFNSKQNIIFIFLLEIRRCGMILNETTLQQRYSSLKIRSTYGIQ